jgi:hypothetical protein
MVIKKDALNRAMTIELDGHIVEFNRQDAFDLILAYCYEGDEVCEANSAGLCNHALEALFEAARKVATITVFNYEAHAVDFAERMDARVIGLRSAQTPNGEGRRWVVAG